MSHVFYRYVRPIKFDETRLDFVTMPKGGICLRFEETPEAGLWFTFSRCHPEDHFNKAVAKKLADERAVNARSDVNVMDAMGAIPYTEDVDDLCSFVLSRCIEWKPDPAMHPLVVHYMSIEWKGFAEALSTLLMANEREKEKGRIWLTATHAMKTVKFYERGLAPILRNV